MDRAKKQKRNLLHQLPFKAFNQSTRSAIFYAVSILVLLLPSIVLSGLRSLHLSKVPYLLWGLPLLSRRSNFSFICIYVMSSSAGSTVWVLDGQTEHLATLLTPADDDGSETARIRWNSDGQEIMVRRSLIRPLEDLFGLRARRSKKESTEAAEGERQETLSTVNLQQKRRERRHRRRKRRMHWWTRTRRKKTALLKRSIRPS